MYLSKLELNPDSSRVRKALANPYQLHRTIMTAFMDNLKERQVESKILFKINKKPKNYRPSILIQSALRPDWTTLMKDASYLVMAPLVKEFQYPKFKKGSTYQFQLLANPTKKTGGKRVGMYKDEEQFDWLKRKAEMGGFKINLVGITYREEITARANKNSNAMTFQGVQFEGVLQIEDPEKFVFVIENGLGSGKPFGFGFLTISKA